MSDAGNYDKGLRIIYANVQKLIQQELLKLFGKNLLAGRLDASAIVGTLPLPASVHSATTPIAMTSGSAAPPVPLYTSDGTDYVYMSPTVV